ncbi:Metallopeptidase ImmA [compost metagenome]
MAVLKDPFKLVKLRALSLFSKYYSREMDLKTYRCDEFLIKLIQDNNIRLDFYSFSNSNFCGLLTIDDDETTIVVNKNSPAYRRNFTIAHELGHFFLHKHLKTEFPDRASDLLNSANDAFEKQANIFASEIVLPDVVLFVMLRSKYSFFRISVVTQTSHETLRWRLVSYLRDNHKILHNKSIELVENYVDASVFGYKQNELQDFIAMEVLKKYKNVD